MTEAFRADSDPTKLNLGVGAYRTEEVQPYVLNVVKTVRAQLTIGDGRSYLVPQAERRMLEQGLNKEYLPIEGLAAFNTATASLLLGADNPLLTAVCAAIHTKVQSMYYSSTSHPPQHTNTPHRVAWQPCSRCLALDPCV